jgi:hypothetical protein
MACETLKRDNPAPRRTARSTLVFTLLRSPAKMAPAVARTSVAVHLLALRCRSRFERKQKAADIAERLGYDIKRRCEGSEAANQFLAVDTHDHSAMIYAEAGRDGPASS